jgi:hypothetical protein
MKIKITLSCIAVSLSLNMAYASETVRYSYNAVGQLVSAVYNSGDTNAAIRFDYDANSGLAKRQSTFSADGDTLDDSWELENFGNLAETDTGDPDTDGLSNSNEFFFGSHPDKSDSDADSADDYNEWIAGTNPTNAASYFHITAVSNNPVVIHFDSLPDRKYTLYGCTNLVNTTWVSVPGAGPKTGSGAADSLTDTNSPPIGPFYKIKVEK